VDEPAKPLWHGLRGAKGVPAGFAGRTLQVIRVTLGEYSSREEGGDAIRGKTL